MLRQPLVRRSPPLLCCVLLVVWCCCCCCVCESASSRSKWIDGALYDRLPLVERYWPADADSFLHNPRAHPPHFHSIDLRPPEQVNALPAYLATQPRPRPTRPHSPWRWPDEFSPQLVIVSPRDVLQQQQVKRAEVACHEPFLLVLPNLTRTTPRELAEQKRAGWKHEDVELSWEEQYEPEKQPPLWWLTHPLSEPRQHAVGLQLIRSFVIPRYYSGRSAWHVPLLKAAKVRNADVWQLHSDVCGSVNLLHLTSNTNVSITVNLTTAAQPSSPLSYTRPLVAEESTALNQIVYSPHSYTFMLPATHLNRSIAYRRFHWRLPARVPITLYLPTSTVNSSSGHPSDSGHPRWSRRHCHNATEPPHSRTSALHFLHQHQPHQRCPNAEDTTRWPHEPALQWDVWHVVELQAGRERVELVFRCDGVWWGHGTSSCDATQPADVVLDIEFVDRDADVPLLPVPTRECLVEVSDTADCASSSPSFAVVQCGTLPSQDIAGAGRCVAGRVRLANELYEVRRSIPAQEVHTTIAAGLCSSTQQCSTLSTLALTATPYFHTFPTLLPSRVSFASHFQLSAPQRRR